MPRYWAGSSLGGLVHHLGSILRPLRHLRDLRERFVRLTYATIEMMGVFVVIGGVTWKPIEVSTSHDMFEWFAQIWIPALVGGATVFLSIAALVASRRATRLAHEVERQRAESERTRSAEQKLTRLQDFAVSEARTLTAWVIVAQDRWTWKFDDVEKVGVDQHGPTLLHRAQVELGQSIVPGAKHLLDLTVLEVDSLRSGIPAAGYMPDAEWPDEERAPVSKSRSMVIQGREQLTRRRIQAWALDPVASARQIASDYESARHDLAAHLDYRRFLPWQNLRPYDALSNPPASKDRAQVLAFYQAAGYLSHVAARP